mmetsp:Transcript_46066/g.81043  ORF Transcript_46066/g.81043 Transcript_46066/m.81043 type:complete len:202 (-) Transcript_46066:444-1049(-)
MVSTPASLHRSGLLLCCAARTFERLRAFSSPSRQRWQCLQSLPFEQLPGFQNHAQGLQSPRPCFSAPTDGIGPCGFARPCSVGGFANPGGGVSAAAFGILPSPVSRLSLSCCSASVSCCAEPPSPLLVRIETSFVFLRDLISPSGHKWQWRQSRPFLQESCLKNQAHGLHVPLPCSCEPMDGSDCLVSVLLLSSGKPGGRS